MAKEFTVKEIEVFKIADNMALPANVKKCPNGRLLQRIARDVSAGSVARFNVI
jgi:hypothetical protein